MRIFDLTCDALLRSGLQNDIVRVPCDIDAARYRPRYFWGGPFVVGLDLNTLSLSLTDRVTHDMGAAASPRARTLRRVRLFFPRSHLEPEFTAAVVVVIPPPPSVRKTAIPPGILSRCLNERCSNLNQRDGLSLSSLSFFCFARYPPIADDVCYISVERRDVG